MFSNKITVHIRTEEGAHTATVRDSELVGATVHRVLQMPDASRDPVLLMGGTELDLDVSFGDNGVVDDCQLILKPTAAVLDLVVTDLTYTSYGHANAPAVKRLQIEPKPGQTI